MPPWWVSLGYTGLYASLLASRCILGYMPPCVPGFSPLRREPLSLPKVDRTALRTVLPRSTYPFHCWSVLSLPTNRVFNVRKVHPWALGRLPGPPVSLLVGSSCFSLSSLSDRFMLEEAHIQGAGLTSPPPVSLLGLHSRVCLMLTFCSRRLIYRGRMLSRPSPVSLLDVGRGTLSDTFSDGNTGLSKPAKRH